MKIRQGFVSNSSSSSFLINPQAYDNSIFDLTRAMIEVRNNEEAWSSTEKELENLRLAENKGIDRETPIRLDTCNYDTFIFKYQDLYYVSTCNNHDFSMELNGVIETGGGHDAGDFIELEHSRWFWYFKLDMLIQPIGWEEQWRLGLPYSCEVGKTNELKHWEEIVRIKATMEPGCPKCFRLANPRKGCLLTPEIIVPPDYIPKPRLRLR